MSRDIQLGESSTYSRRSGYQTSQVHRKVAYRLIIAAFVGKNARTGIFRARLGVEAMIVSRISITAKDPNWVVEINTSSIMSKTMYLNHDCIRYMFKDIGRRFGMRFIE